MGSPPVHTSLEPALSPRQRLASTKSRFAAAPAAEKPAVVPMLDISFRPHSPEPVDSPRRRTVQPLEYRYVDTCSHLSWCVAADPPTSELLLIGTFTAGMVCPLSGHHKHIADVTELCCSFEPLTPRQEEAPGCLDPLDADSPPLRAGKPVIGTVRKGRASPLPSPCPGTYHPFPTSAPSSPRQACSSSVQACPCVTCDDDTAATTRLQCALSESIIAAVVLRMACTWGCCTNKQPAGELDEKMRHIKPWTSPLQALCTQGPASSRTFKAQSRPITPEGRPLSPLMSNTAAWEEHTSSAFQVYEPRISPEEVNAEILTVQMDDVMDQIHYMQQYVEVQSCEEHFIPYLFLDKHVARRCITYF